MRFLDLGFLLALLALPPTSQAITIRVDLGGGGDFHDIQPAIDAAADGDTVLVAQGVYSGPPNIDLSFYGRAITLQSESGPDVTVIDCDGADHGTCLDSWETPLTIIDGFTIIDGWGVRGGGIWIINASPTIRNCVITDCTAVEAGGGIAVDGGSPTITNCVIEMSSAENGGIVSIDAGDATFEDCVVQRGRAHRGGAIYCRYTPSPSFTRCDFLDNTSSNEGGCAYLWSSSPTFDDCSFLRNYGGKGAIIRGHYSSPTLVDSWFAYNWSFGERDRGHSIDLYHTDIGDARIENCTFCAWNLGGATCWLLFFEDCAPTVERCVVAYNTHGGAAGCSGTRAPTFRHCISYANSGGDELCGIQEDNLVVDPLFCNFWVDDLTVAADSPCLPANNPWGELIGRFEEGCTGDDTPVEPTTWGAIKAMYR